MPVVAKMATVPDKLFYRIQEVAKLTGVKPHVLRYWETEFRQLSPRKDMNDQRRYTRADIELVFEIKKLLYEERFTIAGAKKQLRRQAKRQAMVASVDIECIRELRRDVTDLLSLLDNMEATAA
jgi:DNA-binding transcriptional MerR regulator